MRLELAILLVASACTQALPDQPPPGESFGATSTSSSTTGSAASTSSAAADTTASSASSSDGGPGLKLDVGSDETGEIPEIAEVFGHSGQVLYRLDPDTKEVTEVGPFAGCTASIIDIALDAESNMYGTAFSSLWSIDRMTAQCTKIADGSYPTSLSFVPAGTLDAAAEALVGFDGSDYVRIDVATGAVTVLATLADGLESSGDLVSVIGGETYLTVIGPGCNAGDCIVRLNPSNGLVLQNYGPLPYDQVFGLAFWGGRAYGFARSGDLFEIDFAGGVVATTPIPIPGAPPGLEFFGAGSTTSAPPAEG